jgi:hypothetical protein
MRISELEARYSGPWPPCRCGHVMDSHDLDTGYLGYAPCEECRCRCYRGSILRLVTNG